MCKTSFYKLKYHIPPSWRGFNKSPAQTKFDLTNLGMGLTEQQIFRSLLEETNLLPKTVKELFGVNAIKRDISSVRFRYHRRGTFRIVYVAEIEVKGLGLREMVFKISHQGAESHTWHQIFGKLIEPRRTIGAVIGGIWQLSNKKVVLTEEFVKGPTFHEYTLRRIPENVLTAIATVIVKKCFISWKIYNGVFIEDPHRHQFIITNEEPPFDVKLTDTGYIGVSRQVQYEIPNDGRVIIRRLNGEIVSDLEWAYKTPPRELLERIIFNLEKPDETAGEDYFGLDDGYQKAYDLPRIALLNGITQALGQADAKKYLREVQGVDKELDALVG